jgi:hypothetical protein
LKHAAQKLLNSKRACLAGDYRFLAMLKTSLSLPQIGQGTLKKIILVIHVST